MAVRSSRLKEAFPRVWLSLQSPPLPDLAFPLALAARAANTVVDISTQPGLWGGALWATDTVFMATNSGQAGRATDEAHALDLTQAHLLQTLSSIGRGMIDFYLLPVGPDWLDVQVAGALQALEFAKQDGLVRYVGLTVGGNGEFAADCWRARDAFDLVVADPETISTLNPLASSRGTALVHCRSVDDGTPDDYVLVGIRSPEEAHQMRRQ